MTSSNADKFTPRPGMVFETLEQAEAWLDATPDTSSIITNTPGPGQFTVVMQQAYEFGDYRDLMASVRKNAASWPIAKNMRRH